MTTPTASANSDPATRYALDVVAGKVVAGKRVIQACERHLRDLKRSRSHRFPYVFEPDRAARVITFAEKYCKPSQGELESIVMQPWDHFVLGSIFGWVDKKTSRRRFRHALVFIARKNGKSLKASISSLFCACKDDERGAKIYQLANTMKQARETTFDECKKMVAASPSLSNNGFRATRDLITFGDSEIKPQAADSHKLDGLNTHLGVFDEIHEYKNYKLINVIKNSTASRRQPLLLYITTAGYVLDGPLMDMYERGCDVLDGVVEDERTFYYIAQLDEDDDIEDPSCWAKANPNLGISVQLEDMIEQWEQCKNIPAERGDFITKRLNLFVNSGEQSFVDLAVLKRNEDVIDIEELKGRPCVGGFDLSITEDLTSGCLEFPLDDGRVFVLSHSWVPEAKVRADNEKDLPYIEWQAAGHLTICNGPFVDYQLVYDWYVKQAKLYQATLITYDPANAYRLVADLQAWGGEEWTKAVRQGHFTLSPALKDIKELLLAGKVVSNNNPMLRWYINNVKLVDDRNGNWLPTKQGRYRKIDGFAAWLNAHTETMKLPKIVHSDAPPVAFLSRKDLQR